MGHSSLSVLDFHFLLRGAAPLSLSISDHSVSPSLFPHSVSLSVWLSPTSASSSPSPRPCSVISLMFGHFAPSFCTYHSLSRSLVPSHFIKSNNDPALALFPPSLLPPFLSVLKGNTSLSFIWGNNHRQIVCLGGGGVRLCTYMCIVHVSICVPYSPGINHSDPPTKSAQGGLRSRTERGGEQRR